MSLIGQAVGFKDHLAISRNFEAIVSASSLLSDPVGQTFDTRSNGDAVVRAELTIDADVA